MMLSMDTVRLQQEILGIVQLLQNMNPAHLGTICSFVHHAPDELMLPQLTELISEATPSQIDKLISMTVKNPLPQFVQDTNLPDTSGIEKLPQELIDGFAILLKLFQLQKLLNGMSILQLMKMFEVVPPVPQVQQLQLLEQLQQFLGQLLPQALKNLQQELKDGNMETEQQMLSQLLKWDRGHLYQPLRMLLQLSSEDLLEFQDFFPKLQPIQMRQLITLLQLLPYDVLQLKRLLTQPKLEVEEESSPPPFSPTPEPTATPSETKRLTLRIVEQPPEKSVYKRNLKPNPMIQVVGEDDQMDANLHVAPVLLRCDNGEEKPKLMTGNKPLKAATGRVVVFRRMKITATSHQQGESLFAIKFELRRYRGNNDYEVIDYIQSNPICVLSHSTQLKPASSTTATITEVIPYSGSSLGGTRVAVLGNNFVDTPSARVRFDDTDVIPQFHGPRTLICSTPTHKPGIVSVRVSNDSKVWSPTAASFQYEETESQSGIGASSQVSHDFDIGIDDVANSICAASWQGNLDDIKRESEDKGQSVLNMLNGHHYGALHYTCSTGDEKTATYLLDLGAKPDVQDGRGNSALFWACHGGHEKVLKILIEHGADVNIANSTGDTTLHLAAHIGNVPMVLFLTESGARLNQENIQGLTALHIGVLSGQVEVVQCLLEHGSFVNAKDEVGDTPLHLAVLSGRLDLISLLLEHDDATVDVANNDLETPLHLAAILGFVTITKLLLRHKANPNIGDADGVSPLVAAVLNGRTEVVDAMLACPITNSAVNVRALSEMVKFTDQSLLLKVSEHSVRKQLAGSTTAIIPKTKDVESKPLHAMFAQRVNI
eukprot:TRINITY_DN1435_c0_g1_i3.p1 TRINITY_DN1435_c0_g1~~TRINITY_DN1435_c0_g1_i3.p1  ORF type:complete len:828 (+),score=129.19 TRINITY_DN1435_c0_g1_i3:53-2536(+)